MLCCVVLCCVVCRDVLLTTCTCIHVFLGLCFPRLVAQRCSMTSEKDCVQGQIQAMKEHLAGLRPGLGSLLKVSYYSLDSCFTFPC